MNYNYIFRKSQLAAMIFKWRPIPSSYSLALKKKNTLTQKKQKQTRRECFTRCYLLGLRASQITRF